MKIERVEDMLDDIREQGDQLTQIQDAMRQPLGYVQDVDEADLEAELEVQLLPCARSLTQLALCFLSQLIWQLETRTTSTLILVLCLAAGFVLSLTADLAAERVNQQHPNRVLETPAP